MTALEQFAELKMLPLERLQAWRLSDDASGGIRIDYGANARARIRKSAATAHPTIWAIAGKPMRAFGHQLAPKFAERTDKTLLVVEGESDALTAWLHQRPALGVPGATMTHVIAAPDVLWADRVLVVREPGDAGSKFVDSVAARLREIGFTGEILDVSLAPHKDVSDLHIAVGSDRARFATALDEAIARAVPVIVAPPNASKSNVLSFDDLARRCTEQVDWFIDGLLRRSGVLLVASQPKVGKSDTARNLTKAIATGGTFLGRACQSGKVLWIGLEEPISHLRERLEVMQMQGLENVTYVVDRPAGDESAYLRSVIEQHKPDFVIIDTIGRFSNVENINDYSQVKRATQPILDLRMEYGTTFALLHHNNRGNGVLGSVMWEGMVDTILSITRNEDGTRFAQSRQRSGTDMEPTALTMDHDTGAIACVEPKFITDRRVAEERILRYLELLGRPASREELARRGGRSASAGRAAVDALVANGLVRSSGDGTKNSPRVYVPVSISNSLSSVKNNKHYIDEEPDESRALPDVSPMQPEEPDKPEEPDGELMSYAREVLGDA